MSKKRDITGERFSRLVAVEPSGHLYGRPAWLFHCDCGNNVIATLADVVSGKKKSCGCYRKETAANTGHEKVRTHGMTKTRIWNIWSGMRRRCKTNPRYRDISVCPEWEDFMAFYAWSITHGYDDSLTIDRINNKGDYCPDNCRWTTYKAQENNRSNNIFINVNGDVRTISEWSEAVGISSATLSCRLKAGWPIEDLFIPPNLNNARIRREKHEP